MYSLYDITRVCPKIEPDATVGIENHELDVANHVAAQEPTSFCKADNKYVLLTHQLGSTGRNCSYEIGSRENVAFNETLHCDGLSSDQPMKGEMRIHQALSRRDQHEMAGKESVANETRSLFQNGGHDGTSSNQMGTHETMLAYQTSAEGGTQGGMLPYETGSGWMGSVAQVGTHGKFLPHKTYTDGGMAPSQADARGTVSVDQATALNGLSAFNTSQTCHCFCHVAQPSPSHLPAFGLRHQRPSVIMVPTKWRETGSALLSFKDDCDSSDGGDDDGNQERYFRKNMDGTTAKFKLSKEDWERIPINTFPSGGRLLSGDWTRIFLSKVKESNPWCSLRFKNNHVRSENSRKIHSAVFFRGGAECKRPECNVKVRFVIRKEKGKFVEVTYVGNVCHRGQPSGSDFMNDAGRNKRVRRPRSLPD